MPPERKKRGKEKEKKVQRRWGWTQAAGAWASDAGLRARAAASCDWSHDARPGAVRSQPVSPPRRSPGAGRAVPRTRRPPGRPGPRRRGWGGGERASAPGCVLPECSLSASTDTNTSPKAETPRQPQQSTTRSSSCPPLPSSPLGSPRPLSRPTVGAQRFPTR